MTPRVAIDARKLRDGGIGTYIHELIASLATRAGAPEVAALLDPSDFGRTGWPPGVAREIAVRAGKYGLWEHVAVPRAARAAGGLRSRDCEHAQARRGRPSVRVG